MIHSLVERHLDCFQFLAIMSEAAINIHIEDLCRYVLISLGKVIRYGISGHDLKCLQRL